MISTILFDFDGTIADTLPFAEKIILDVSQTYTNRQISKEELENMRDFSIQEVFSRMHVPFYKLPLLMRDVKKYLHERRDTFNPIKDMPSVLKKLKQKGFYLGILTSNNKPFVNSFLQRHNIDFFDAIHTGTSLFGKARVINAFLEKNRTPKQATLYVGDEIRDIEAAKKAKIPIIAVTWGLNSKKGLLRFKPDYIAENPEDIAAILASQD